MKRILLALIAAFLLVDPSQAQAPFPAALPTLSFRNDTTGPIIVQGASKVNNQFRRGQPIVIAPGKTGFDVGVPLGDRYITIYDGNQPSRVLLFNFRLVNVQNDLSFSVVRFGPMGQVVLRIIPWMDSTSH